MAETIDFSTAFRQCLIDLDINTMRKMWGYVAPHLPQPEEDWEIEVSLHIARTQSTTIPFKPRAYSHAWLRERNFPSKLPDNLRPQAERLYPVVVPGVGVSFNFRSMELRPLGSIVRGAMENAVLEVHADGRIMDSPLVKQRMAEAKTRVFKELMLPFRSRND